MTKRDVLSFLVGVIGEAEADGYQQYTDARSSSNDRTPDDYSHDDAQVLTLTFGGEVFKVVVTKPRKKLAGNG